MQFPSLKNLAENALVTIRRFPFEVLFALAGTIAGIVIIELSYLQRVNENWCLRVMMIANLGFLLSLSATLFTESKNITGAKKLLIKLSAALIVISLLFLLNPGEHSSDYIKFFLFSLTFHLLVAYAAFTAPDSIQSFWQFNKTLFLRFLTGALYSAVLFLGLAAAIGAMNFLFNFKFEWDTFSILFTWIVGMFSTLFFLAGVPADIQALNNDFSYPKGLKVFTQYVLIPLATVYVVILLAYEIKILIQWELPKGLVSHLILGYAVFGILSLLLVFPVREQDENKWLKTYARSFYFLLIPLLILLFTAAGTRIFRYGLTEMRYFLVLLACWLLFITIYFLIAKKQNIKLIPISLSILTLLSIYGPQSAFSVSLYSQRRVLVETFKKNNAFKNGKLLAVDSTKIKEKEAGHAVATLNYLITQHDLSSLQPYFNEDLNKVSDSLASLKNKTNNNQRITNYQLRYDKLSWAKSRLGLNKFSGYYRDEDDDSAVAESVNPFISYSIKVKNEDVTNVKGYDYIIDEFHILHDSSSYNLDGIIVKQIVTTDKTYILKLDNHMATFNVYAMLRSLLKLKNIHAELSAQEPQVKTCILPESMLTLSTETGKYLITLKINKVNFNRDKRNNLEINYFIAYYLIKKK
jgi:hypothetical protein